LPLCRIGRRIADIPHRVLLEGLLISRDGIASVRIVL
jgi:hypothetical protein